MTVMLSEYGQWSRARIAVAVAVPLLLVVGLSGSSPARRDQGSRASIAGHNAALRDIMVKDFLRPDRNDDALRHDLASRLGASDIKIGGAATAGTEGANIQRPQAAARLMAGESRPSAAAGTGNSACSVRSPRRFNCELLFFHETSPGENFSADTAVLKWDFGGGISTGSDDVQGGSPDDVAAIQFGDYNAKCYLAGVTSEAAWTYYPGTPPNQIPPAFDHVDDVSQLVTRASQDPGNNDTAWRVHDEPGVGGIREIRNGLPKPFVGYVAVSLQHVTDPGARRKANCPQDFEEIRAAGQFQHFQRGSGDWNGLSFGAGFGPVSVNFTPGSSAGEEDPGATGVLSLHGPAVGGVQPTRLDYTGPRHIRFDQPFTASARLTAAAAGGGGPGSQATASQFSTSQVSKVRSTGPPSSGVRLTAARVAAAEPRVPVPGAPIRFTLGLGGGTQSCTAATDSDGVARCVLVAHQQPGPTTLTVRYLGAGHDAASSLFQAFTVNQQFTEVVYTGPKRVANGVPAHLSGVLRERGGPPIAGRRLRLALGTGGNRQECTGTTDSSGTARCTVDSVDQPLNDTATVTAAVNFAGDQFYLASSTTATVLLEYYTGRAYGATADVHLPPAALVHLPPQPDTTGVRTAHAFDTTTPCTAQADAGLAVSLVSAGTLCPKVSTRLAPGTSTSTASVAETTIGIPGLPVIDVRGALARSTSTCRGAGSATGSTDLAALRVAGQPVSIPTSPGTQVDLPGGARLIINERKSVPGAEHGLTINAVHLTDPARDINVVIASATSDVHNCAS